MLPMSDISRAGNKKAVIAMLFERRGPSAGSRRTDVAWNVGRRIVLCLSGAQLLPEVETSAEDNNDDDEDADH